MVPDHQFRTFQNEGESLRGPDFHVIMPSPPGEGGEPIYDCLWASQFPSTGTSGYIKEQLDPPNPLPLRPYCLYRFANRGGHYGDIVPSRIGAVTDYYQGGIVLQDIDGGGCSGILGDDDHRPILKGTVSITLEGAVTVTDDGSGNLAGGGCTGEISYLSGAFTVSYTPTTTNEATCQYKYLGDDPIPYGYNCFIVGSDGDYALSADVVMDFWWGTGAWAYQTIPQEFDCQFWKRQYDAEGQPVDTAIGEMFPGHNHPHTNAVPSWAAHVFADGFNLPGSSGIPEMPSMHGAAPITPNLWPLQAGDIIMLRFFAPTPDYGPDPSGGRDGWIFLRGQMAIQKAGPRTTD